MCCVLCGGRLVLVIVLVLSEAVIVIVIDIDASTRDRLESYPMFPHPCVISVAENSNHHSLSPARDGRS